MEYCLITFRSITPAQRAEQLLRREKIVCSLRRTPAWLQEKGCGYSIRLSSMDVPRALEVLERQRIPYQKVYTQEQRESLG